MHIVFVTTELVTPNNVSGGLASFTANMARIFTASKHAVIILLSTVKESEITFDDNIVLEKVFIKKLWWNILDKTASISNFK